MMAKKGLEHVDDMDLPEPMRQMLAMQAMRDGKPFPPHLMRAPGGPIPYGGGTMMAAGDMNSSGKVGTCC